jgi:glucose uptake protein GlcU
MTNASLTGWASGHFGWFGLTPENFEKPTLNYIGVVIACLSGVVFLAIRVGKKDEHVEEHQLILNSTISSSVNISIEKLHKADNVVLPTVSKQMRIIACGLVIFAGVLFGLVFTPSTYIQDHRKDKYPSATKNGLHYVFAMYTGILLTSCVYYAVYIIFKRNRPYVDVQSILPAFVSGIMWGIAKAAFILANSVLNQTISFPLIQVGSPTIAVLWSIFYFKDIVGSRNYLFVTGGTLFRIIAAVLVILSKPISN